MYITKPTSDINNPQSVAAIAALTKFGDGVLELFLFQKELAEI
jgi:hypothetical protein